MVLRAIRAGQLGVLLLLSASLATAQRREGKVETRVLRLSLEQPVRFGNVVVPAHTYRAMLGADGLALVDPETMVLVATVPVAMTDDPEPRAEPLVQVYRSGARVEIVVHLGTQVARAQGVVAPPAEGAPDVTLAGKAETTVVADLPEQESERALVDRAVQRYFSGIKHCADKAHRNHWTTDDPRFVSCVCPLLEKWRLPKVKAPLRVDHPLVKGRSGFSFTATPGGRPAGCRVWVGAAPPDASAAPGTASPGATP